MELINQTTYDKPTLSALNRLTCQTIQKTKTLVTRAVCLVMGVGGIVVGIMLGRQPDFNPTIASLIMLYGLIFFAASLFWSRFQTWTSGKMMSQGMKHCTFTFEEDALIADNETATSRYAYHRFTALAEDDNWLVLYLDPKHGIILSKKGFQKGDAAQARELLEATTGLTFRRP